MSESRGRSPFHPGQPVVVELFTGRRAEIERIMERGVGQTRLGKPTAFFIQGEYGIGKSSIALYSQYLANANHKFVGLYAPLGGAKSLEDVASRILEATLRSGIYDTGSWGEQVRDWLGKTIGKQTVYGVAVNFEALRKESPKLASPAAVLTFLEEIQKRNRSARKGEGVFLILDEINGIATNPEFSHFLKALVDSNAASNPRLPLLLMLCGIEERRRDLIRCHQPVERLFDVIDVLPMTIEEMTAFYTNSFASVGMTLEPGALEPLLRASAGEPKIMHTIGDCVFWAAKSDDVIDEATAHSGIWEAAQEVGRKYVDSQVYAAIQSQDYQSILRKVAGQLGPYSAQFTRKELQADLNVGERGKLDNFLAKMKALRVIKPGNTRGQYQFCTKMVQMYIWLRTVGDAGHR